jgi:hypothetical protein
MLSDITCGPCEAEAIMWRDSGSRQGWGEWLVGWLFALLVIAITAQILVDLIRPLLPWIGLALLAVVATTLHVRRRDQW